MMPSLCVIAWGRPSCGRRSGLNLSDKDFGRHQSHYWSVGRCSQHAALARRSWPIACGQLGQSCRFARPPVRRVHAKTVRRQALPWEIDNIIKNIAGHSGGEGGAVDDPPHQAYWAANQHADGSLSEKLTSDAYREMFTGYRDNIEPVKSYTVQAPSDLPASTEYWVANPPPLPGNSDVGFAPDFADSTPHIGGLEYPIERLDGAPSAFDMDGLVQNAMWTPEVKAAGLDSQTTSTVEGSQSFLQLVRDALQDYPAPAAPSHPAAGSWNELVDSVHKVGAAPLAPVMEMLQRVYTAVLVDTGIEGMAQSIKETGDRVVAQMEHTWQGASTADKLVAYALAALSVFLVIKRDDVWRRPFTTPAAPEATGKEPVPAAPPATAQKVDGHMPQAAQNGSAQGRTTSGSAAWASSTAATNTAAASQPAATARQAAPTPAAASWQRGPAAASGVQIIEAFDTAASKPTPDGGRARELVGVAMGSGGPGGADSAAAEVQQKERKAGAWQMPFVWPGSSPKPVRYSQRKEPEAQAERARAEMESKRSVVQEMGQMRRLAASEREREEREKLKGSLRQKAAEIGVFQSIVPGGAPVIREQMNQLLRQLQTLSPSSAGGPEAAVQLDAVASPHQLVGDEVLQGEWTLTYATKNAALQDEGTNAVFQAVAALDSLPGFGLSKVRQTIAPAPGRPDELQVKSAVTFGMGPLGVWTVSMIGSWEQLGDSCVSSFHTLSLSHDELLGFQDLNEVSIPLPMALLSPINWSTRYVDPDTRISESSGFLYLFQRTGVRRTT